jgi:hypothetical protein
LIYTERTHSTKSNSFIPTARESILPLSTIILLDYVTVPTVWYFVVFHFLIS